MQPINQHFTANKPTFSQLVDFKNRYSNAEYVETVERFANFELYAKEREEKQAEEAKQAELDRIKQMTEGGAK